MKNYDVELSKDAEKDLQTIYHYIKSVEGFERAESLVQALEKLCASLVKHPLRGHIPPEFEQVGILLYREVHHKSYRVIYQVTEKLVMILGILDGRRNLQEILMQRVLR